MEPVIQSFALIKPWMLVNENSQIRAKTHQRRTTGESPNKGRPEIEADADSRHISKHSHLRSCTQHCTSTVAILLKD